MPLTSLPCMVSVEEGAPPVLIIPDTLPDWAPLNVTKLPLTDPSWLLLILMVAAGLTFEIPWKTPQVTRLIPSIELLLILARQDNPAFWQEMPIMEPLVAALKPTAPLPAIPTWLLLIFIVFVTAALF